MSMLCCPRGVLLHMGAGTRCRSSNESVPIAGLAWALHTRMRHELRERAARAAPPMRRDQVQELNTCVPAAALSWALHMRKA